MARRGRRHDAVSSADTNDNARDALDALLEPLPGPLPDLSTLSTLTDFGPPTIPHDRRTYTFGQEQQPHQVIDDLRQNMSTHALPSGVRVDVPQTAAFCVRRKERREVLFAKRLHKRGRGGSRRRDWRSEVKC